MIEMRSIYRKACLQPKTNTIPLLINRNDLFPLDVLHQEHSSWLAYRLWENNVFTFFSILWKTCIHFCMRALSSAVRSYSSSWSASKSSISSSKRPFPFYLNSFNEVHILFSSMYVVVEVSESCLLAFRLALRFTRTEDRMFAFRFWLLLLLKLWLECNSFDAVTINGSSEWKGENEPVVEYVFR